MFAEYLEFLEQHRLAGDAIPAVEGQEQQCPEAEHTKPGAGF